MSAELKLTMSMSSLPRLGVTISSKPSFLRSQRQGLMGVMELISSKESKLYLMGLTLTTISGLDFSSRKLCFSIILLHHLCNFTTFFNLFFISISFLAATKILFLLKSNLCLPILSFLSCMMNLLYELSWMQTSLKVFSNLLVGQQLFIRKNQSPMKRYSSCGIWMSNFEELCFFWVILEWILVEITSSVKTHFSSVLFLEEFLKVFSVALPLVLSKALSYLIVSISSAFSLAVLLPLHSCMGFFFSFRFVVFSSNQPVVLLNFTSFLFLGFPLGNLMCIGERYSSSLFPTAILCLKSGSSSLVLLLHFCILGDRAYLVFM